MRALRAILWLGAWAAVSACAHGMASGSTGRAEQPRRGLDYRVILDASLADVQVEVCFRGTHVDALVPGASEAAAYLRNATVVGEHGERPVRAESGRIPLDDVRPDECLRYHIDLRAAAADYGGFFARRIGDTMLAESGLWLWRPRSTPERLDIHVRFELPPGVRVSVPWPRQGDVYHPHPSVFGFVAYTAFGRFDVEEARVAGGRLQWVHLGELPPSLGPRIRPWIEAQARAAALLAGKLPRPLVQVLVVPAAPASRPVRFGITGRGGGASVALSVSSNAGREALMSDWVAVHELVHLYMPYLEREDAWLSEGVATYYQEILRARAGLLSEAQAWANIRAGFRRGREAGTGRTLREESHDMFETRAFERVYWAGAALALMADVQLRTRAARPSSLDAVVADFSECCTPALKPYPAREAIETMDRLANGSIFETLAARHLDRSAFPDVDALLRKLGVTLQHGRVRFDETAVWAETRRAITKPPEAP